MAIPSEYRAQVDVLVRRLEDEAASGRTVTADAVRDALDVGLGRSSRGRWAERIGPVYATGQLQRLLPGPDRPPVTDEAVRDRHRSGRLVGFKTADGRWAWPAFQFEVRGGRLALRPEVIELWRRLPWSTANALELVSWLTGPRRDLDGGTPIDHVVRHGIDDRLARAVERLRARLAA